MHTYIHILTYTYIHAYITYITYIRAYMHTHIHTYIHIYITYTHTYVSYMHTIIDASTAFQVQAAQSKHKRVTSKIKDGKHR